MKVDANIRNPGTRFLYFLVQSLDLNSNFKSDFFFTKFIVRKKKTGWMAKLYRLIPKYNSTKGKRERDDLDLSLPAYVIGKTLRLLSEQKLKEDNQNSYLEMETDINPVKNEGSLQSKLKKTVMFRDKSDELNTQNI